MKLCVKKIYCSNCRRAVTAVEPLGQQPPYRILCSKCGMTICVSNGIYWRRGVPGEAAPTREPTPAAPRKPKAAPRKPPARPAAAEGRPHDKAASCTARPVPRTRPPGQSPARPVPRTRPPGQLPARPVPRTRPPGQLPARPVPRTRPPSQLPARPVPSRSQGRLRVRPAPSRSQSRPPMRAPRRNPPAPRPLPHSTIARAGRTGPVSLARQRQAGLGFALASGPGRARGVTARRRPVPGRASRRRRGLGAEPVVVHRHPDVRLEAQVVHGLLEDIGGVL